MNHSEIMKEIAKYKNIIQNLQLQLANSNKYIQKLTQEKHNLEKVILEKEKIYEENKIVKIIFD